MINCGCLTIIDDLQFLFDVADEIVENVHFDFLVEHLKEKLKSNYKIK